MRLRRIARDARAMLDGGALMRIRVDAEAGDEANRSLGRFAEGMLRAAGDGDHGGGAGHAEIWRAGAPAEEPWPAIRPREPAQRRRIRPGVRSTARVAPGRRPSPPCRPRDGNSEPPTRD